MHLITYRSLGGGTHHVRLGFAMVLSGELSLRFSIAKGRFWSQVGGQRALEGRHCEMCLWIVCR